MMSRVASYNLIVSAGEQQIVVTADRWRENRRERNPHAACAQPARSPNAAVGVAAGSPCGIIMRVYFSTIRTLLRNAIRESEKV